MAKQEIIKEEVTEAPVEEVEELEEVDPNEVFDDAFSNFSRGEEADDEEEDEDPAPEPEAEGTEDAGDAEDEPEPEPAAAEAEEKPQRLTDDELIDRLSSAVADKAKPKEEPKQEAQPEEAPLLNAEEQSLVEEYQKDWPDVAKAESLIRKSEYQQIVKFVFDQVASELRPLAEQVNSIAQSTHYTQLQDAVGEDYDDIREGVVAWVGEQPDYLQSAYNHVIQSGTVDEVADLINRYRQATGSGQPQPQPPVKKETELPPAAKKAVQSLAPVSSKRSAVPVQEDAGDFESAFSKFAGKFSINA